ncbi:hypothetical protein ACFWA1_36040 [Streptomyces sp. NPDC060005]|uniref:hypothetical protein n=1 Tax=Streptomyces sp. NPDC060005 TaxID=3347034 RepID=UPI00368F7EFE
MRPLNGAQRRAANREQHHARRIAQNSSNGVKGVATAWSEDVRRTARLRAAQGDLTVWTHLAQTLEWFCSRHPATDPEDRRTARQTYHWEVRLEGLADADPKTLACAWWDRARSIARDQEGETGWTDLALTLKNLADHYKQ